MADVVLSRREARPAQLVGPGAAGVLLNDLLRRGRLTVLLDVAVRDRFHLLSNAALVPNVIEVSDATTIEAAETVVRAARQPGVPMALLAIGGGNVIDQSKLALAIAARGTGFGDWLKARGVPSGLVQAAEWPASSEFAFAAIPTTIGTGSEVNSSACFEIEGTGKYEHQRMKCIASLPGFTPSVCAYDPEFTAAPSELLTLSAFEIVARIVGAYVGSASLISRADLDAERLLEDVTQMLTLDFAPDVRLRLALLSAESHDGWALRGRGRAPSLLWVIATELSMSVGLSKNAASLLLIGPWLRRVVAGDERWGRVAQARIVSERLGALLEQYHAIANDLRRGISLVSPSFVAGRAVRRFGAISPSLQALGADGIASLIADACDR